MNLTPKRALLSVSDKTGIVELAQALAQNGIEIISTGGTAKAISEAGIAVTPVSELTGFPEMMQGRVKSLHPRIHGGILGRRDVHEEDAKTHDIAWIDMVTCNLYPFAKTIQSGADFATAIENIDIGGPSMIRSAAKNMDWVCVSHDPADYPMLIEQLASGISFETRKALAAKAFAHTAQYDSLIAQYLNEEAFPETLTLAYQKHDDLRYGENPHQRAAVYHSLYQSQPHLLSAKQHQGKALSYNNINDGTSALNCVMEFENSACVIIKHANPCGAAQAQDIDQAFERAWQADNVSAFGGVVALNRPCTQAIAEFLSSVFIELVIAPGFSTEALVCFEKKPNCRLLDLGQQTIERGLWQYRALPDGLLIQETDVLALNYDSLNVVTEQQPDAKLADELLFSWRVLKHIKSNGILISKGQATVGVGAGQVSRVDAVKLAIDKSNSDLSGAILASDAFFPFPDSIEQIAKTPIKTIIQPGGSINDAAVIEACNQHGIAMVFTGNRCFNH